MAVRSRRRLWGVLLAVIGVLAILWLVREAGTEALAASMDRLLPWVPLLLLLEGGRIGLELLATRAVLGPHARSVPGRALLRAQLVGNSVVMSTPLGRPAGEAVKALMLAPHVGTGRGFAVGVVGQSLTLVVNGTLALAGWAGASFALSARADDGGAELVTAMAAMGAVTLGLGLGVQLAARSVAVSRAVGRIERARIFIQRFRDASAELSLVPTRPLLLMFASRGLQVAQFALLLYVFGTQLGLQVVLVAQGIYLVGAAAGDLVPAQLGVIDGAFALAAPLLGVSVATGIAIALAVHLAQLAWVAIGAFGGMLLGRGRQEAARPPAEEPRASEVGVAVTPSTPPVAG